jgi:hypothetical protein
MGLLDDLKSLAAQQTGQQTRLREAERIAAAQKIQKMQLHLKLSFSYLIQLVELLNTLKPSVVRHYHVPTVGDMKSLVQEGPYRVDKQVKQIEQKDILIGVTLQFGAKGSGQTVCEKNSPSAIQSIKTVLYDFNLTHEEKEIKNPRGYVERAIIFIKHEIKSIVAIIGDFQNYRLVVRLKNVERAGTLNYLFGLDEFGEPILEELAKLIVGREHNFNNLGRHQQKSDPHLSALVRTAVTDPKPSK